MSPQDACPSILSRLNNIVRRPMSPLSFAMYIHYHIPNQIVKYKNVIPNSAIRANPIFCEYPKWVPTFSHPVAPPARHCSAPKKYHPRRPAERPPRARPDQPPGSSAWINRLDRVPGSIKPAERPPAISQRKLYIIRHARQLYIDFFTQTIHNIRYAPFKNQYIDVDNIPARPPGSTAWINRLDQPPGSTARIECLDRSSPAKKT